VLVALLESQLYGLLKLIKHRNYDVWENEVTYAKTKEWNAKELPRPKSGVFVAQRKTSLSRCLGFTRSRKILYKRFITALLENSVLSLRDSKTGDVLVSELVGAFLRHAEFSHFKRAVGGLVEIYGEHAVNEFSPKKLKVVRGQMV